MSANVAFVAVVASVALAFFAGCGGDNAEKKQKTSEDAEKIAALEKDVAKLRGEVHDLRRRFEMDAKARSRSAMKTFPNRPDRPGPYALTPEERHNLEALRNQEYLRNGGKPPRRPIMREDPANMTPEQRRAWHEERRRMREERMRSKISEPGKQANPSKEPGKQANPNKEKEGESK